MELTKNSKVLIATFSPWKNGTRLPINGNLEPLVDFFTPKIKCTVLVDQVYPGSDFVIPRIEIYKSGSKKIVKSSFWMYILYPLLKLTNSGATHISFKLRDFLSVIDGAYKTSSTYDFFIGLEAINAIAGILLRKIGKVKKVIYYVSDYTPKRYSKKWFNDLYLFLDRYAANNSDFIWDVSPAIHPARINSGLDPKKSAPVLVVPNALYPSQIKSLPEERVLKNSIVFMGTLGIENGPDLAIESMHIILKKIPSACLYIIGGQGNDIARLEKLVKKLNLESKVIFRGFISDRNKVSEEIRKYAIALAPYRNIKGSARLYGDATKIRAYMAAGLPTITTNVPPLGRAVAEKNAAIIVDDTKDAVAKAIIHLLTNKSIFIKMKKNAIYFAQNNTWENEYSKAFVKMKV